MASRRIGLENSGVAGVRRSSARAGAGRRPRTFEQKVEDIVVRAAEEHLPGRNDVVEVKRDRDHDGGELVRIVVAVSLPKRVRGGDMLRFTHDIVQEVARMTEGGNSPIFPLVSLVSHSGARKLKLATA